MKGINTSFAIGNGEAFLKFEFVRQHAESTAVKTQTAQHFECHGKESLVIHGFGEVEVSKIARIGLVVE